MRRNDLAGDLVDRPVPGGDQAADTDRLLDDAGRAAIFLELEVLQDGDGGLQVADTDGGLGALGEGGGGAHLLGDGVGHVAEALLVFGGDALQKIDAFLAAGLREGGERLARGLGGLIDVGGGAHGDLASHFFIGGIDHIQRLGRHGIDPSAVDVEFQIVAHLAFSLASRFWSRDVVCAEPWPRRRPLSPHISDRCSQGKGVKGARPFTLRDIAVEIGAPHPLASSTSLPIASR